MEFNQLESAQQELVQSALTSRIFLQGPAGCGKTTTAVARLRWLVDQGVPPEQILVLVPQRTLGAPYYAQVRQPGFPAGGEPTIATLGGLAQRLEDLFWPMFSGQACFHHPDLPPSFLTLETAQYYLAQVVKPLRAQGYFESVAIDPNRLLSQVLDNLNKSAAVGFEPEEIAERLTTAWIGKPEQARIYADAQECAVQFRRFCLEHNLLDFSLQLAVFARHLWPSFLCREYLFSTYRHLIYENIEEDVPVVHDILLQWLPRFDSALLLCDSGGGYRSFLGADPQSALRLQSACDQVVSMDRSWVMSGPLYVFRSALGAAFHRQELPENTHISAQAFEIVRQQFVPQLLNDIVGRCQDLVQNAQVPPGEIAILAPFLSDSLRFTLLDRFEEAGLAAHSHRPSRSLREEPATHCLLTLARLAHPHWELKCTRHDVRTALFQSIQGLDLVRADILSQIVFRPSRTNESLSSFDQIRPEAQLRITYQLGMRYQQLRDWIQAYREGPPAELDIFLSRLFGEVLSQPGFGFHQNFDYATTAARLIESVQKFRWGAGASLSQENRSIGLEYIQMVSEGIFAAQNLQAWQDLTADSIFVAPAYTFLMMNQPVRYQFWLDIGSLGWWARLYQPLTHPVVLSRQWQAGRIWSDSDEYATNQATLEQLTAGLIRRCREGIFLCSSTMNEQGEEPRGPLLQALQLILRRVNAQGGAHA